MAEIRVLIADAQRLFADAVGGALGRLAGIQVLTPRPTEGLEAVQAATELRPDVALIDYWVEGMHGPATTASILAGDSSPRVLILAWLFGPREIEEALRAGAAGFVPKSLSIRALGEAIHRVHAGELPVSTRQVDEMISSFHLLRQLERTGGENFVETQKQALAALTPREIRILQELSRTGRADQAAEALSITPSTMRTHIYNICRKTGARTQMEAVAAALQHGIIGD